MNSKIKTLVLTDGSYDHASSRIRAILYFKLLKEFLHLKICWLPRIPVKKENITYKYLIFPFLKRLYFFKQVFYILLYKYELVYIQRFFLKESLIRVLKKKKSIIIFDFDDAIYLDSPGKTDNYIKTMRVLIAADHIIVSSNELAAFCKINDLKNVSVITTPIDPERFHNHKVKTDQPVVIGWIGSSYTSDFLKLVEPAFVELNRKHPFKLLVIGANKSFKIKDIEVEVLPWFYNNEPDLLNRMDIGIMPLPDNDYSKGKGGYKLFQYMAAGIPVIASPIGINTEIVKHGLNGFLAENTDEWIRYTSMLIQDPEMRKRMGEEGRNYVIEKYSRTICFGKLSEIIKNLIEWKPKNSLVLQDQNQE